MMAPDYHSVLAVDARDRLDLFLTAAQRLGTPVQNVEKDFWVCWTLDALYNGLPPGGPRLLFKGGTSLSKVYGLIKRFSEDIDITVFRDDLAVPASVEELEVLSGKQRKATLESIQTACQAFIADNLSAELERVLGEALTGVEGGEVRVELDHDDPDRQTLLVWYPTVTGPESAYIRRVVRIESGAKSALDPHRQTTLQPYVAQELSAFDLNVRNVTAIEPVRTFWDKVVIAHGLRGWFERRGVVRQEGQRISRHYYDLHCLMQSAYGATAMRDNKLAIDCVRHARMFFNRPDFDLASATAGSFALTPSPGMLDALRTDYERMTSMIFGAVPPFEEILASIEELERTVNAQGAT